MRSQARPLGGSGLDLHRRRRGLPSAGSWRGRGQQGNGPGTRRSRHRERDLGLDPSNPRLRTRACRDPVLAGYCTQMLSRGTVVLVVLAVLAVSRTAAQTRPTDPDRKYPLPTYAEDWRFLSDPDRHADPWYRFKYVPLADGTFVSFGGEARETYESYAEGVGARSE